MYEYGNGWYDLSWHEAGSDMKCKETTQKYGRTNL